MIYKIDNLHLGISESETELIKIATKKLGRKPSYFRILKKSLDARKKADIHYVYSIEFSGDESPTKPILEKYVGRDKKIIVVGCGPAGLFCALRLIDRGFKPIIIERGECVEERAVTVTSFFNGGVLNLNSNVQYGEGGAGTFSDGKLNTQTHNGYNAEVLEKFAMHGAPEEVLYLNKPHIGSDCLRTVVKNMREFIIKSGGKVRFSTLLEKVSSDGKGVTITLRNLKTMAQSTERADAVVLAIGHSARDTFRSLHNDGMLMERRDFAIGVRIEHLQREVGRSQYGNLHDKLPPADYKLVSHAGKRTAFTFCMCPGGYVIPSASEAGGVVTNGMSNYARDGVNANSALLVQLNGEDYGSDDLFAGMDFQRKIERIAYDACGNYSAPVQLVGDFLKNKVSAKYGSVKPTYARGCKFAPLSEILPKAVIETLKVALPDMGKRLKCFANPDAVMTGVETRFTSPVRLLRCESGESCTLNNVYPCGEGSGYSGGITSSAADGMRIADKIYLKFSAEV